MPEVSASAIDAAIVSHRAWVSRLKLIVSGRSTENLFMADARNDSSCVFGAWLQNKETCIPDAQKEPITRAHRDFHRQAGAIVDFFMAHGPAEASMPLIAELDMQSKMLVRLLLDLKRSHG